MFTVGYKVHQKIGKNCTMIQRSNDKLRSGGRLGGGGEVGIKISLRTVTPDGMKCLLSATWYTKKKGKNCTMIQKSNDKVVWV
jgi:thymidylate synthase